MICAMVDSRSNPGVSRGFLAAVGFQGWRGSALVGFAACTCLIVLVALKILDGFPAATCGFIVIGSIAVSVLVFGREPGPQRQATPPEVPSPPFALMMDHLVDPILLVSGTDENDFGDRRYLFANGAARNLLRLSRSEGPLTTAVRAPEVLAAVEKALFGGAPTEAHWHSHGALERFWQARVNPLASPGVPNALGSMRLALLTLHDETEMRRIESTRADFLANASHELRTPLASLAGFVETLRGHAKDDPAARDKFLAIMQTQAERMRCLIDDLMSLSRIELSEHIRPSGRVDLTSAVMDVIDALSPQAARRGVMFDLDLPSIGSAWAVGDRDQIVQVVQNLVENAVKYSVTEGRVSIAVEADIRARDAVGASLEGSAHLSLLTPDRADDARYVALRVRDSGSGIARNHFPRLTERFYRVEGQKVRDRPGDGVGSGHCEAHHQSTPGRHDR